MAKTRMQTPPKVAELHPYGPPDPDTSSAAYRKKLDDINATTATADNILTVITDPRKMLGLLILIGMLVGLVYLLQKPVAGLVAKIRESRKKKQQLDDDLARLGSTLSSSDQRRAENIAAMLLPCFRHGGDDEDGIYSQLRQIDSTAMWVAVQAAFGAPEVKTGFMWWNKTPQTIDVAISNNLSRSERRTCYDILTANGVDPQFIYFWEN